MRNALAVGTLGLFAPALVAARLLAPHSLLAIWGAKALLNVWRCATALLRIHGCLWGTWRGEPQQGEAPAAAAEVAAPA